MLDLVKAETERIDSRFLEPACGSGNFLVAVLRRKLAAEIWSNSSESKDYVKEHFDNLFSFLQRAKREEDLIIVV